MKLFGLIRNYSFWIVDFFKGSPVLKNLKEIKSINESKDSTFIDNYQEDKVNEILKYSKNNIPFYKNMEHFDLNNFPIIDKLQYKKNSKDFCSPHFKTKKLYKAITSGSTGTPFVSYQNMEKKKRNTADVLYFSKLAGYRFGESLFYLKIWSENNRKSKIFQFLQNIVPIDVIQLSKDQIEKFVNKLKAKNGEVHINGYSSALEEICKYFDSKSDSLINKKIIVGSIITQSEALTNETKKRLIKYFSCMPCSRYSNVENGIIAQQTLKENNLFKINHASYKLEILKLYSNKPAEHGQLGRIVITDFFNYAMPFIRYDTGDVGRYSINENGSSNLNFLEEVQGRKLDLLLDTKGSIISSYIVYKNMFNYPEIDQYQLIQEDKRKYRFIISMKNKFEKEGQLKKEFIKYLGVDADFRVEYIDEIPLLSSGKRRKIVNNYIKNNK